jgi:hypothetical protein
MSEHAVVKELAESTLLLLASHLLVPEHHAEIEELQRAGVPSHTIAALYAMEPFDIKQWEPGCREMASSRSEEYWDARYSIPAHESLQEIVTVLDSRTSLAADLSSALFKLHTRELGARGRTARLTVTVLALAAILEANEWPEGGMKTASYFFSELAVLVDSLTLDQPLPVPGYHHDLAQPAD